MTINGRKIAEKSVDVAETLVKWGIKGTGFVFLCGAKFGIGMVETSVDLAKEFSGSDIGSPIGKSLTNNTMKLFDKGAKAGGSLANKGVELLANKVRDRL